MYPLSVLKVRVMLQTSKSEPYHVCAVDLQSKVVAQKLRVLYPQPLSDQLNSAATCNCSLTKIKFNSVIRP